MAPRSTGSPEERRDQLVSEFERFLAPLGLAVDPGDLGLLLDWKESYSDGRLGRWRRQEIEEFLLDWCPAKLSATAEDVQSLPAAVGVAMTFLSQRGLLESGSDTLDQLVEHAVGLTAAFLEAMGDPSNFGMAKSVFAGLDLDQDGLTASELDAAIARFNALPEQQRDAIIGGPSTRAIVIGPVVLPDERTLRSEAIASPVIRTFVELGEYFAPPGRLLTKSGNLRLADARTLVDQLGTGDVFRPTGTDDWQGSTRSASQLPILDHWKWWAVRSGVLRVRQGRLVAVEAWRSRTRKVPLQELLQALRVLAEAGPLHSERWWRADPVLETLDISLGPLLGRLLEAPRGLAYQELLGALRSMLGAVGVSELYPGQADGDFSTLVDLLERVGVVVHTDPQTVENSFGSQIRTGGTLLLSPVGLSFAVDLVREEGVDVQVVPAPEAQTVDGLVALTEQVDLDGWWSTALTWVGARPDPDAALEALLVGLERAEDPALLLVVLDGVPTKTVDNLVPTMRRLALGTDPRMADLPRLAIAWLDRHGELSDGDVDADAVLVATMVALGRLAQSSAERLTEALATAESAADMYAFIRLIGQRMPPYAVELLDAIGSSHPDKAVAKGARKELFRVRSRLTQARDVRPRP